MAKMHEIPVKVSIEKPKLGNLGTEYPNIQKRGQLRSYKTGFLYRNAPFECEKV